jgi:hypothetical protein
MQSQAAECCSETLDSLDDAVLMQQALAEAMLALDEGAGCSSLALNRLASSAAIRRSAHRLRHFEIRQSGCSWAQRDEHQVQLTDNAAALLLPRCCIE